MDSLPPSATCTYLVSGNITLQGDFHLNGVKFLLKSEVRRDKKLPPRVLGANIRLCQARLALENCIISAADSGMWGGIYLADSSSKLTLLQTEFRDSYHGIVQADSLSQVVAKHSWFYDNYISLQLAGNRDTVQYCVFSSKPSRMKEPFDSVSTNEYYYSLAHVKNAVKHELNLKDKSFSLNLLHQAVYGIFLDVKHVISVQESYFIHPKIAAIYHPNGDLRLTNQNEIHISQHHENTQQMKTERQKYNIPDSLVYGIYAEKSHDELSDGNFISASKTAQTVGYYGFNTTLTMMGNRISNLRTGIHLDGERGVYDIRRTLFNDNRTGLHIHRTKPNDDIKLTLRCNEFVSSFPADAFSTTGVLLTSPASVNVTVNFDTQLQRSILGGCTGNNEANDAPNGNEVQSVASGNTPPDLIDIGGQTNVPMMTAIPLNDFTFIDNRLSSEILYSKWLNENIDYFYGPPNGVIEVKNENINVVTCTQRMDNGIANASSCRRIATGTLNRQGQQDDEANVNPSAKEKNTSFLSGSIPSPTNPSGAEIRYKLPEGVETAELVVYHGLKAVHTETLRSSEPSIYLNTSDWKEGFYYYTLFINGRPVQSRTLSVMK